MMGFIWKIWDLFTGIFNKLQEATFVYDDSGHVTSLGSVLFACLVIGFVASLYWKGAKSQ